MRAQTGLGELVWPLAPGGVLLFAAGVVGYALRGPSFEFPSSPAAAVATLVGAVSLGHLSRIAAAGIAWGAHAVWAMDLFNERSAADLIDELSPRRLSPALLERLDAAVRPRFGIAVEPIARPDTEEVRERKARQLDEAIALARARAGGAADAAGSLPWLEARSDGARALFAALGLSSILVLGVAAHDYLFSRSVAHALSFFSLVVFGLILLAAALAALGRARSAATRLALEAVLSLVAEAK